MGLDTWSVVIITCLFNRVCLSLGLVLTLSITGCEKRDESPAPTVSERGAAPSISTREASLVAGEPVLGGVVESTVDEVMRMAESAQEAAETVVNEAQAQVESLLARVRDLMGEQDYAQATKILAQLTALELTPEQRHQVNELKAELEKILSGKAIEAGRKALGGLLDGNR